MCFYSVVTEITLPDYLKQISQLLEERRYPEVVLHAQHVLKQYPRHILTYRLLGQALLEQQDYAGAADLLQRVLSADPNDFIAHLGLSIAYGEEALYSQAIWHLLHAFEQDPYNVNIQRELRELYRQRDGEYAAVLAMTPAALTRLHFKGGQYQQATAGLREVLRDDTEERVDLEVLLAESLWRNRQRLEAVEVCEAVLTKLPNCITVNAILGDIYLNGERPAAAIPHLQVVQALTQVSQLDLDPETAVGVAFLVPGAPPLPQRVLIRPLDEQAIAVALGLTDVATTPTIAEWVSGYGLEETAVSDEHVYDWLAGAAEERSEETAVVAADPPSWLEPALAETAAPQPATAADLELFLQALGGRDVDENEVSEDELPDWLQTDLGDRLQVAGQVEMDIFENNEAIPEWLQNAETAVVGGAAQGHDGGSRIEQDAVTEDAVAEDKNKNKKASDMTQGGANDPAPESMDDALSWLDELIGQKEPAARKAAPDDEDLPDWLQDLSAVPKPAHEAIPNDDLPEWLKEAALTSQTTLPGVLDDVDEAETASGDTDRVIEAEISPIDTDLSWLDALTAESPRVADDMPTMTWEGQSDEPQDFNEAMAWLEELAAEQQTPIEEPPTIARGLFGTETLAGKKSEPPVERALPEGPSLEELAEGSPDDMDEAMAWLEELAAEADMEGAGLTERPSLAEANRGATNAALQAEEMASDDEAMAWLNELADVVEPVETAVVPESQAAAVDDDLSAALDWLEAQTVDEVAGAGGVVDEPTTQAFSQLDDDLAWLEQVALLDDEPAVVSEPKTAVVEQPFDIPEDPDEALAWLEQMASEEYEASDAAVVEAETMVSPPVAEVLEEESVFEVPEDPDEAMAWLEQLAAQQGAPLAELPSLQADEAATEPAGEAVSEVPEDPDEAMAWLDQLAAQQGAPLAELSSLPDDVSVAAEAEDDELDAMAWLDELATDAGVDISDEHEAVVEAAETAVAVGGAEAEDDELDAMAWLNELAVEADVDLAEATVEAETAVVAVEAESEDDELDAVAWLDELTASEAMAETAVVDEPLVAEPEPAVLSDGDLPPDDLDEAMAWLEQLAAQQGAPLAELPSLQDDVPVVAEVETAVGVVEDEPEVVETVVATQAAKIEDAGNDFAEPPDDLDEAMAWLEQLAAQQGAPLDELPSLAAAPAEVVDEPATDEAAEAMAWLDELALSEADETAVADAAVELDGEEATEDAAEAMAWLDELAGAAVDTKVDASNFETDELEEAEDDGIPAWLAGEVAEELPDVVDLEAELDEPEDVIPEWLSEEPVASLGDTGWLRSLAEPDMTGWLGSEEAATTGQLEAELFGSDALVEPEPLPERPFVPPPVDEESPLVPLEQGEAVSLLAVDEDHLSVAREAVAGGDVQTAVATYKTLLEDGSGLSILIADLESATLKKPEQMPLQQLLGDAYMRNGQLQKALEAYRQALKVL